MRFRYTPEMLAFLERGYRHMSNTLLTRAFNKRFGTSLTATAIKATLSRHGFRSGRKTGMPAGESRIFSVEQIRFIKRAYVKMPAKLVCREMNRWFGTSFKPGQVVTFVHNHGINSGRTGQFEKGQVPPNKGLRRPGWAPGRMAETQFKPGQKPVTTVPVGTEVLDRDGYTKVKISDGGKPGESRFNWKYKHVLVWEEHNGPVPEGHAVIFKNGDTSDIRIENLALVTRAELLYLNRNGLTGVGEEMWPTVEALAKLEVTRFEREHDTGIRKAPPPPCEARE